MPQAVQFRRVSGAEVLSQSEFELPLSHPATSAEPRTSVSMTEAGPPAPVPPVEPAEATFHPIVFKNPVG